MTSPVTLLNDCALTALRTLPDNSVDCLITSPPYWGLRDYGIEPTAWPACSYVPMPGLDPIHVPAETSCLGLEPTLHAFLAHLVLIFDECRRVLKPTGSAWVNMGDGYASTGGHSDKNCNDRRGARNIATRPEHEHRAFLAKDCLKPKDLIGQPWRVAFALQASGWYLRQDNIWHKPNPMPESIRDRATKSHEYVFHLTKSERYFFDIEAWSEKASEGTNPRRAGNGYKQPDGWDTGPGSHGTYHRNGREKGKPARKHPDDASPMPFAPSHKGLQTVRDISHGKALPQHDSMIKNNGSMDAALAVMPLTRNKRSVWTVPTVAYSEAHYATYPPRLITPPMLASTSAKGCCSQCGSPWQRIVEKTDLVNPAHNGSRFDTGKTGARPADGIDRTQKGERYLKQPTDTWQPTCRCYHGYPFDQPPVPAVVLDPFAGSGTTGQVALNHGRHAILIERGPHNIALIRKRLAPYLAAPVLALS